MDFGHKDTIYKLKSGWLKFGKAQTIHQTFPLYCKCYITKWWFQHPLKSPWPAVYVTDFKE